MPIPINPYSYPGSMPDPADEELYQKNSVMAPPASRLRKIMDFALGGKTQGQRMTNAVTQMAPAAILSKQLPGTLRGSFSGYKRATNEAFPKGSRLEDIPYVYGDVDKLGLDSKGAYSALYDPATGKMGYTEASHSHHPLQEALKKQVPGIDDESTQAKIRRIVYQGAGGEKGTTTIIPPYTKPNVLGSFRRSREQSYFDQIAKVLENKGLIPPGEEIKYTGFWQD